MILNHVEEGKPCREVFLAGSWGRVEHNGCKERGKVNMETY